ncbi:MAG: HD domain-containing protein, partial [Lachnospiraceae bacterium]|nr:HD domain-containing protein [Lachnospiraceae bacterium]
MDREKTEKTFAGYTEGYDSSDPKIKLKIDHTYRVAALCERIANTVPGVDAELAWLSGMLHDIGRFEQVRRYGTFSDADSVDHAQFGADLLF